MRKVLLLLAFAARLDAATEYALTVEVSGPRGPQVQRRVVVLVDGAHWCRRENGVTKELSNDAGKTVIALDHEQKTWWVLNPKRLDDGRSLQVFPGMQHVKMRDLKITTSDEPSAETFAGYPVRKYNVLATYTLAADIGGTPITSKHGFTIYLWTNETVTGSMIVPPVNLTTGIDELDAKLAPAIARVPGFALKTQLAATRAFAGGMPQVLMKTVTVDGIRTVTPPPHVFETPPRYTNQEPIITAPGVSP